MTPLNAADLAPLLPLPQGSVPFQYYIALDSTFDSPSLSGVALIDTTSLPQQYYQVATQTKGGQRWYCGVNVFQDGGDLKYQAFFWLGDAPPNGLLTSAGKFQQFSPPLVLTTSAPQIASVNIPTYNWLTTSVLPAFSSFSVIVKALRATPNPLSPQAIVRSNSYTNDLPDQSPHAVPSTAFEYDQMLEAIITDNHSYQAGISTSLSVNTGFLLAGSTFTVTVSFQFTYSHTTTSETQSVAKYVITDGVDFLVPPGKTVYYSVVFSVDPNATATLSADLQLSGTINGIPLTGTFLQALALAMAATNITVVDATTITYTVTGIAKGSVVSAGSVKFSYEKSSTTNA